MTHCATSSISASVLSGQRLNRSVQSASAGDKPIAVDQVRSLRSDAYVRPNEGQRKVYVLEGAKAVWKDIQLIYDNGEMYIAALDQSSTGNLWPGDLILLDTQELFDGKLVKWTWKPFRNV